MDNNSAAEPLLAKQPSGEVSAVGLDPVEEKEARSCWKAIANSPRLLWDNGVLCVLVAAFLFSIMSLMVKMLGHHVPTFQVVLARSVFSFVITLYLLWSYGVKPLFGSPKRYPLLMLRGALGAIGMTLSYFGIANLKLAEAVTIFFSNPALTALLEWLFTGEPLGWMGSISSLACLLGVMLVANPPFLSGKDMSDWGMKQIMGVVYSFGGAWFIAASFIAVRFLGKSEPALILALWYHLVASLTSGVPLLFSWPAPAVMPDTHEWTLLFGVAFTSFLGQLLLNRGFQLESATKGAAMNVTQVLYSYIWDLALFHHPLTAQGVCGGLLIMSGVIFTSKRRRANKTTSRFVQEKLQSTAQALGTTSVPIHQPHLGTHSTSLTRESTLPLTLTIPENEVIVIPTIRRALSRNSLSLSYNQAPSFSSPISMPIGSSPRGFDPAGGAHAGEIAGSMQAHGSLPVIGSMAESVMSWFEDPIDDYDRYEDQLEEDDPEVLLQGLKDRSVAEVMEPEAQLFYM